MNYNWVDDYLLGKSLDGYQYFGAHFVKKKNTEGVCFRVYAPLAKEVYLIGDFNNWSYDRHHMNKVDDRGIFEIFIENVKEYDAYKYHILTACNEWVDKADPFAFFSELRPGSCSRTFDITGFPHTDASFMTSRNRSFDEALSIYEVHLGSWIGKTNGRFFSYEELVEPLAKYVLEHGFNALEIMPITQYPFDGSWGYQVTGYFSVDSRYGNPKQLMYFVNKMHEYGIKVILDFVPVHFAIDEYALTKFDGSNMYEYDNEHEFSEWGTKNFDLGKDPVRSFLMSAVNYFATEYHFDGIRMDAVSNLIFWDGNGEHGHNEGAIEFIKRLNSLIHDRHSSLIMIAEDSSAYDKVCKPILWGGLGFDYKWDLGWMNDTLKYYEKDPCFRKYHHGNLTFSMCYFYSENFILPLSHDEVVFGKGTIINKMWGSYDNKFAQLRNLYAYQYAHPGKKLNFMGNELATFDEWNEEKALTWELSSYPRHDSISRLLRDLNLIYLHSKALHHEEYNPAHFQWLMADNAEQSIISFKREVDDEVIIAIFNMTPNFYGSYDIGVPYEGEYQEIFNTDKDIYGGFNQFNGLPLQTTGCLYQNQPYRITIKLASFGAMLLRLNRK